MRPIRIPARRGWLLMSSLVVLGLITGSVGTALVSSVTPQPTTSILANRIQVPIGTQRAFLLRLPSLGYLYVDCIDGGQDPTYVYWKNSETYLIDAWTYVNSWQHRAVAPSAVVLAATIPAPGGDPGGTFIDLGRGVSPDTRRAAHVELRIRRSAANACVVQAVGTSWALP